MPVLMRLGNMKIMLFADDHNPPHFHVATPDHDALIPGLERAAGADHGTESAVGERMGIDGREPEAPGIGMETPQ